MSVDVIKYTLANEEWVKSWLNEYLTLEPGWWHRALALQKSNTPRFLYRYRHVLGEYDDHRPKIDAELACIESGQIYGAPVFDSNDPLDSYPTLSITIAEEVLKKGRDSADKRRFLELFNKNTAQSISEDSLGKPEIIALFHRFLIAQYCGGVGRASPVASLTSSPDSLLMWSHYADSHRGICIEYDRVDDAKNYHFYPVIYARERFNWDFVVRRVCVEPYSNTITGDQGAASSMAFWWKSSDWAYEKEWRVMCSPGDKIEKGLSPFFRPSKIIMGSQISNNHEKRIIETGKRMGIKVVKAFISTTEFKVTF